MHKIKFHTDFRLNGNAFSSVKELLHYSKNNCNEILPFLENWFSDKDSVIVQTSGSTGKPKKIAIAKKFMINSASATGNYFNLPQQTKALLCLSPDFIAGKMMLVRALVLGWDLEVMQPNSTPLRKEKSYDFVAMVPMQVQKSISDLHKVTTILVGGGVLSKAVLNRIDKISSRIYQSYGMTETVTHVAVRELYPVYEDYYTTLQNVSISKDDRNCLVIDAPKVATNKVITNDLVQLVSKNQFKWLGRMDNIINSGGIKMVPEQIEEKLLPLISHPFFIAKKEDEILGEKAVLVIEGKEDKDLNDVIKNTNLLSKFEKPKEILFLKNFVRTETNKINRIATLRLI